MKTILAAVDFSPASEAVVSEAMQLAPALDARVVVLTVLQPPAVIGEYAPAVEHIAEITAAGEKTAARELAKVQAKLQARFIAVETVQRTGAPAPGIVGEAERVEADYIIIGSHGHTALYDLLVGSTAHGVLKHAKCPVIIIPAQRGAKHVERAGKLQHAH